MAIAPVNKFITIAVPVAPGEQQVYSTPTGTSAIVLYAQVSNVAAGTTTPKVTFTHRRKTNKTGYIRNNRIIKEAKVPSNDSLIIIDGRLVLQRDALISDSIVIVGIQSGITFINDVKYDFTTGITTVITKNNHNFLVGNEITMSGIAFTCSSNTGITSTIFPNPQSSFTVTKIVNATTFVTNTGPIGIAHTYLPAIHVFVSASPTAITNTTSGGSVQMNAPTAANYNGSTGVLTLTIANHGLSNANTIQIEANSLTFKCSIDNFLTTHTYPRSTDPAFGANLIVSNVTTNTFTVNVGVSLSGGLVGPLQMEFVCSILENSTV